MGTPRFLRGQGPARYQPPLGCHSLISLSNQSRIDFKSIKSHLPPYSAYGRVCLVVHRTSKSPYQLG
jgi:hypothetical protein